MRFSTTDQKSPSENLIDWFRDSFDEIGPNSRITERQTGGFTGWPESIANLSTWSNFPLSSIRTDSIRKLIDDWHTEGEFVYLLDRLHDLLKTGCRERIFRRIRALYQMAQEDDGDAELSIASLKSFVEFLLRHPKMESGKQAHVFVNLLRHVQSLCQRKQ